MPLKNNPQTKKKINVKALICTIIGFIVICCLTVIIIFDRGIFNLVVGVLIIIALLVVICWIMYKFFADIVFEEE